MKNLPYVHFADPYLSNPANPVLVNLIGAGGTGSQMLSCLARIHQSMLALNHPGLMVRVYDDDTVSPANLGRQLFAESEIGLYKSAALVSRMNRFLGTNWKAVTERFCMETVAEESERGKANLYITCVDSAVSRFEIAELLQHIKGGSRYERGKPLYWMDLGNSRDTGQVLLATIGQLQQPESKKFLPVGELPFVTEKFRSLLENADTSDDTPSCSLAEALTKQDLFINSALANVGASLLWQLFREGMLFHCGFFLNLREFRTVPIPVMPVFNTEKPKPALTDAA